MRKNTKAAKAANVVQVTTTNNTTVKHAKFITLQQVAKQNAANAHLYTAAQHAVATNVILAAQAYYFTKQVYTNIRKKFIAIKIANNTSCCYALAKIAKQNNAQVVITKNATILRLFAA